MLFKSNIFFFFFVLSGLFFCLLGCGDASVIDTPRRSDTLYTDSTPIDDVFYDISNLVQINTMVNGIKLPMQISPQKGVFTLSRTKDSIWYFSMNAELLLNDFSSLAFRPEKIHFSCSKLLLKDSTQSIMNTIASARTPAIQYLFSRSADSMVQSSDTTINRIMKRRAFNPSEDSLSDLYITRTYDNIIFIGNYMDDTVRKTYAVFPENDPNVRLVDTSYKIIHFYKGLSPARKNFIFDPGPISGQILYPELTVQWQAGRKSCLLTLTFRNQANAQLIALYGGTYTVSTQILIPLP